jgi:3'-phosphoadenosine 5'-phosphosulfate sulfotransferase (PAPS reductase)/FAD synthetase
MEMQADLLGEQTFAAVHPITLFSRKKSEFQPVVLAEAPADILDMPEGELEEKIAKAMAVMKWAMQRWEICYSYSGGKDSSTVLTMALATAAQLKAEGREVKRFLVLNSDTKVENPEVKGVATLELERVRQWIARHELPGAVEVTKPNVLAEWAVHIIGGQTLISTPVTNRNCTTDLKTVPLNRARIRFFGVNKVAQGKFSVGMTGVRYSESTERAANMAKRAESPTQIVQTNVEQDVYLAPIANWSTDDVMEFIGLAVNDLLPLDIYTDMKDVWRIYKDAEGECSVGRGDKPSNACGARHGCYVCNMVQEDKSMLSFLMQEQYAYMEPLSRFREYLSNTLFDMSKRAWMGRSITDGYIQFAPGSYAPAYTQDLLRFALTIDRDEQLKAAELGIEPRFQIVGPEALIAIDAIWSLQGYARPYLGLFIYNEVFEKGLSFEIPKVPKAEKCPMPAPRYIPVKDWDESAMDVYTGLRSSLHEMHGEAVCGATREINSKGGVRTVMDIGTSDLFEVHEESVAMILGFELERLVQRCHDSARAGGVPLTGESYKFYLQYGVISLAKSQVSEADRILRRSSWRERHGLAGYNFDVARALSMSVEKPEPLVEPSSEDVRAQRDKSDAAVRAATRSAVRHRTLSLDELYLQWSPEVPWRQLMRKGLPSSKLLSHCLHKKAPVYSSRRLKGWAIHHFVRLGPLVDFLKANPHIAEKVKVHRSSRRKKAQMLLFAA